MMTRNQIAYNELLRNIRNDQETIRANRQREQQQVNELVETRRMNLVRESQNSRSLDEIARHNLATEFVDYFRAREGARHNLAQEQISRDNLGLGYAQVGVAAERNEISKDQLAETHRSNLEQESQGRTKLSETTRSNKANELLTNYGLQANLIRIGETIRHDVQDEQHQTWRAVNDTLRLVPEFASALFNSAKTVMLGGLQ